MIRSVYVVHSKYIFSDDAQKAHFSTSGVEKGVGYPSLIASRIFPKDNNKTRNLINQRSRNSWRNLFEPYRDDGELNAHAVPATKLLCDVMGQTMVEVVVGGHCVAQFRLPHDDGVRPAWVGHDDQTVPQAKRYREEIVWRRKNGLVRLSRQPSSRRPALLAKQLEPRPRSHIIGAIRLGVSTLGRQTSAERGIALSPDFAGTAQEVRSPSQLTVERLWWNPVRLWGSQGPC